MIIGHEFILKGLERMYVKQKVPHALLFWGPQELGKSTVADAFAKTFLCDTNVFLGCGACSGCAAGNPYRDEIIIHPVNPNGGAVGIDEIRALEEKIWHTMFSGGERCVIIENAETLTPEAMHALLKTLEEPPEGIYFILTVASKESLLETIVSRTLPIRFSPISPQAFEKIRQKYPQYSPDDWDMRIRFAEGKPGKFIRALEDGEYMKNIQKKYSVALNILVNPLYASLQKIEEMIKNEETIEEYPRFLLRVLRSLLFVYSHTGGSSMLKLPESTVKNFLGRYPEKECVRIIKNLYQTEWLLHSTTVNRRMALEGVLIEL